MHPAGTSHESDIVVVSKVSDSNFTSVVDTSCRNFSIFCSNFSMSFYEKIYLEGFTNNKYIRHKYNTVQLYFILGRADLCWNFSSIPLALIFAQFPTGSGS